MTDDWNPDRHIDVMAPLLGLSLTAVQRPNVVRFLWVARQMARIVEDAPMSPDTLDFAGVFHPVEATKV